MLQGTWTYTGIKPHKCKYCDKCFTRSSNCKQQERTHEAVKPYKCKYCDKSFSKEHELTHSGIKPHKCKYCDKRFNRSTHCKEHELIHSVLKPYQCKFCDTEVLQYYREHAVTHTGVKRNTCKYCNKSFLRSSTCMWHERTLTQDLNHISVSTVIWFYWLSDCKRHERVHSGVRPYKCKYCDKCFKQPKHCKEHERTHERNLRSSKYVTGASFSCQMLRSFN